MSEDDVTGRAQITAALEEVGAALVRHLTDGQGISLTTASTLARLAREGPARLTALAAAEGVAQPSMTQLVRRLEQQDLAVRVDDPSDGRAVLVDITESGERLLAECRQSRHDRLAEFVAALPVADQQALGAALRTAVPIVRRMFYGTPQPAGTAAET